MAALNIYKENLSEYTVLSNHFIDYYMEDANEAQLQVYLYLLRMVSANLPVSVTDIADKFKHSEKEVLRALKYWELQKLITLETDGRKNITGIYFHPIPAPLASMEEVAKTAPSGTVAINNQTSHPELLPTDGKEAMPETVETNEEKPSIYLKPAYTTEQLKHFKAQDNAAQLLYVAQAYVGKPLSVNDVKIIYFMCDVLHFSDDLIVYLIEYCVERDKRDFRYMEKVAIKWAEKGITTPDQAKEESSKYDKSVYTVMNALGKSGSPTAKELEFIQRWTNEYGFSLDIITEACDRTVLATDKHRFEYAEGILSNWMRSNVKQKEDIAKADEHYQKQKAANTPSSAKPGTANRFNQFKQNAYDFAALEEALLNSNN